MTTQQSLYRVLTSKFIDLKKRKLAKAVQDSSLSCLCPACDQFLCSDGPFSESQSHTESSLLLVQYGASRAQAPN